MKKQNFNQDYRTSHVDKTKKNKKYVKEKKSVE